MKVIYHGFGDSEKIKIVNYLYKKYTWDPVMILGTDSKDTPLDFESSHECIFKNTMDVRLSKLEFNPVVPIDVEIINALSKYEGNFLSILTESEEDPGDFTYAERKRFYYDLLQYWNSVIHSLNPDLIIFHTWPHTQSCYPLYLLCKYYYKIRLLFVDAVPHLNRNYHAIGNSLEKLNLPFMKEYRNNAITLNPALNTLNYLEEIKENRPPKHIINDLENINIGFFTFVKKVVRVFFKTLMSGYGFKKNVDFKNNKGPYYLSKSHITNFSELFFWVKVSFNNKKLLIHYMPRCVKPNYEKKFIYFAASYQPEAVTRTNAGVFEDQFLALEILIKTIPENWIIYYKENPVTFKTFGGLLGSLRRDKFYYKKLNSYKNIHMVSTKVDTFDLIDNAQAVCTVSGTVAWEAVVRGKPSLSFGSAWYMGCDSIFEIRSAQDALDAFLQIQNGYKPNEIDVIKYADSVERVAIKSLNINKFDVNNENIVKISEGLYSAYYRYYQN